MRSKQRGGEGQGGGEARLGGLAADDEDAGLGGVVGPGPARHAGVGHGGRGGRAPGGGAGGGAGRPGPPKRHNCRGAPRPRPRRRPPPPLGPPAPALPQPSVLTAELCFYFSCHLPSAPARARGLHSPAPPRRRPSPRSGPPLQPSPSLRCLSPNSSSSATHPAPQPELAPFTPVCACVPPPQPILASASPPLGPQARAPEGARYAGPNTAHRPHLAASTSASVCSHPRCVCS